MLKKLKVTCDEATTICDKAQYGEASKLEKVQLNWHLLFCKICALYSKQNKKMSKLLNLKKEDCKKPICLSSQDKQILKKQLSNFN